MLIVACCMLFVVVCCVGVCWLLFAVRRRWLLAGGRCLGVLLFAYACPFFDLFCVWCLLFAV